MAEISTARRITVQLAFLAVIAAIIVIKIIPFSHLPDRNASPAVSFMLAIALIQRDSRYLSFGVAAVAFFLLDIFMFKPLGLWTFFALATIEFTRRPQDTPREATFLFEWAMASLSFVICYALFAGIVIVTQSNVLPVSPAQHIYFVLTTILSYPVIALALWYFLGIKTTGAKPASRLKRVT